MPRFELSIIELHKAAAHFPIALLMTSLVFELLGGWRKKNAWREAAFWNHMFGVAAAVVVVTLGLAGNPYKAAPPALADQVKWHQSFGLTSLAIFLLLALWRLRTGNTFSPLSRPLFLAMALVGFIIVGITGWLGAHIQG